MEAILVPLIVFSCIFGVFYLFISTRNKERMALIESGQSAELFTNADGNKFTGLKIGILMVGVALGILLGNMLVHAGVLEDQVAFPSMVFLFGGLALIVSHLVIDRMRIKN